MNRNGLMVLSAILLVVGAPLLGYAQAQNFWTASGFPRNRWYVFDNWSLLNWPQPSHFARDLASFEPIIYGNEAFSSIESFEGRATPSGRLLFIDDNATFETSNLAFRSGTVGTYTIQLDGVNSIFAAGTETYGFDWLITGNSAQASAGTFFGYGKVDVTGNLSQILIQTTTGVGATIDPAYDAATGQNPITASPWTLTDGSALTISSTIIKNVGLWTLLPNTGGTGQVTINVNNFSLYPTGGSMHVRAMHMDVFGLPASNQRVTLPGSSELRYVTFGLSDVFMSEQFDALFEFTGAASLLRPRQLAGGPDYPTVATTDPENFSLQIHVDKGKIDIQTNITRDGKRFDGSYADIFSRPELELEAAAIDTCNLQYMDFLLPDPAAPNDPLTCFPKNNRCNKSWRLLDVDPQIGFTLINDRDNHTSDYDPVPTGDPPEAFYFCRTESSVESGVVTNGLRMYARSKNLPDFPAILIVLSRYGDFEADFDVDLVDFARMQNCFTGANTVAAPNAHASWYPLADWGTTATDLEADCDVDLHDYSVMQQRWHSSGTGYQVCATPPTANATMLNGDPDIIVCGGPLHVRPTNSPELDCPPCSVYNYVPTCDSGFAGGGGEGLAMAGGAESEGAEEAEALPFFDGEPVDILPDYGVSAEALAEVLLASLSPEQLAVLAAQLAADAEASGDTVAAAVAQLLN